MSVSVTNIRPPRGDVTFFVRPDPPPNLKCDDMMICLKRRIIKKLSQHNQIGKQHTINKNTKHCSMFSVMRLYSLRKQSPK